MINLIRTLIVLMSCVGFIACNQEKPAISSSAISEPNAKLNQLKTPQRNNQENSSNSSYQFKRAGGPIAGLMKNLNISEVEAKNLMDTRRSWNKKIGTLSKDKTGKFSNQAQFDKLNNQKKDAIKNLLGQKYTKYISYNIWTKSNAYISKDSRSAVKYDFKKSKGPLAGYIKNLQVDEGTAKQIMAIKRKWNTKILAATGNDSKITSAKNGKANELTTLLGVKYDKFVALDKWSINNTAGELNIDKYEFKPSKGVLAGYIKNFSVTEKQAKDIMETKRNWNGKILNLKKNISGKYIEIDKLEALQKEKYSAINEIIGGNQLETIKAYEIWSGKSN